MVKKMHACHVSHNRSWLWNILNEENNMKHSIISKISSIALTACVSLGIVATEVNAGERVEFNQFFFAPITTRALFPGINLEGPGVQQTDWFPVYLWRLASEQCAFPLDLDGDGVPDTVIPFGDDHNLVSNVAPVSDPITGVLHNLGCPLAIEGWGIFEDLSVLPAPTPRMSKLTGNVPVYFVHSSDVENFSGVPFNTMTWGDLQELVDCGFALEGSAELNEVLQSEAPVDAPDGAQVPGFKISLKGYLNNGIPFSVLAVGQGVPSNPPGVATVRTYKVKGLDDVMRPNECQQ